jgi:hypothetical protein
LIAAIEQEAGAASISTLWLYTNTAESFSIAAIRMRSCGGIFDHSKAVAYLLMCGLTDAVPGPAADPQGQSRRHLFFR